MLLPRFANRGLIEATYPICQRTARTNFPDSRIGASLKPVVKVPVLTAKDDFPDSRIGASLKRQGRHLARPPRSNFPDSRIGASLKPGRPPNWKRRCSQLPRFANRGLIEAMLLPTSITVFRYFPDSRIGASLKRRNGIPIGMSRMHFPDSRIGASLKPEGGLTRYRIDDLLPRFANRGLIEARKCLTRAYPWSYHFPDSRIGASLKRVEATRRVSGRRDFPDSRIGASLKRICILLGFPSRH